MEMNGNVQIADNEDVSTEPDVPVNEAKMIILSRPKDSSTNKSINGQDINGDSNTKLPFKTLEQREQDYAEARQRILGDVLPDPAEDPESGLTPAEILKMKISQAMQESSTIATAPFPAVEPPDFPN